MHNFIKLGANMEKKTVKKIADQEIHKHESHLHKGQKMTKFAKGGVTGQAEKEMGRNLARVANQGSKR
jgi:hypothetical protein